MTDVIEVVVPADPAVIEVVQVLGLPGPAGPPGDNLAFEYTQATDLSTWTIPVPVGFGRRPSVAVYLASGEAVMADVSASSTSVTITFASPQSGSAVLS